MELNKNTKKLTKKILIIFVILLFFGSLLDSYNCCGFQNNIGVINSKSDLILFWTFLAIIWYSWETRILRKRTEERTEYEFRPFLVIQPRGGGGEYSNLILRNLGNVCYNARIYAQNSKFNKRELILSNEYVADPFCGDDENFLEKGEYRSITIDERENILISTALIGLAKQYNKIIVETTDSLNNKWIFKYSFDVPDKRNLLIEDCNIKLENIEKINE